MIKYIVNKTWYIGRIKFTFSWRSGKNAMGRFGGGWHWELGFQVGGSTIILNMLFCYLRISYVKPVGEHS